jgi:TonB-linked SusC/RagA family outer membrane protein
MIRKAFTYLIFTLLPLATFAQTRTVSGTITTKTDSQPLPGVSVVVKGTNKGTVTDIDGKFSLELAPNENDLVLSYIGHVTQEIAVGQQTEIVVAMSEDATELDEVVVIGYGTIRKSDLTGAVSGIRGNDLTKIPAASPVQALQGRLPGVQVSSNSGAPGSGATVRVRGVGTFGNANPIFVVDGVILENIDFLNSGDIESMEVLKDASATTIYGSRGANGVIMVTTKQGKLGQEAPTINVSADYSMQRLQKKIDLLNGREFAIISNEINPGTFNNIDAVPNTDWQDQIFQQAPMQNYQVSAAGASAKSQYYVGFGYFNQEGIIAKSNYERVTLKFNNTYHLNKAVRLGANLAITPSKQQNTAGGAPFGVYRAQPTITPYRADGSYSPVPGVGNPLADIEFTNNYVNSLRSVNNVFGEADILKGLTFKSSLGVEVEYRKGEAFTPEFFVNTTQQNSMSRLSKGNSERLSWIWENTLSLVREFGAHRFNGVIGYTMQESSSEDLNIGAENILRDDPNFWYINADNINAGTVVNTVDIHQNYSIRSYLGRINYAYDDRYLITATFRTDGSSKFAEDNRFASFPAFALGWNVINETFMEGIELLSNAKIRASWGIVGNEKIPYNRRFSRVENGWGAVFGLSETVYPGSSYGVSGNPNLKWESTYQTDIGLELGFMEDKLTVEIDYYNKNTRDILVDLPVAGYLGNGEGARITYNAADVVNSGLEYSLAWEEKRNDFRYRIGLIGTSIKNEVKKVFGTGGPGDYLTGADGITRTTPGREMGEFYGYVVDGIFQNQSELDAYPHTSQAGIGDIRFRDVNNDGVLNSDDRTFIGSAIPDFLYGANLELGYKAFDLAADFQGQMGNDIYNQKETVRPDFYNFEQHVFNRWRGEGTSTTEPRATAGGYNWLPSTRFIQDGSFFRLRSVTLGYNLPSNLARKASMKSARLYLRGTNVFTLTDFNGYSPEIPAGNPIEGGIDRSTYPVTAVYSVGLNVTF